MRTGKWPKPSITTPYGSQRIATGSHSEQRRFIGEHYDTESDLSYLNARYYQGSRGQGS